ncbi:hypothetical protein GF327_05580 [Candidatus Woesearchaeota archaeon]|nr:hypothetical protein [Candidatus Woesearchaeota archaeon]
METKFKIINAISFIVMITLVSCSLLSQESKDQTTDFDNDFTMDYSRDIKTKAFSTEAELSSFVNQFSGSSNYYMSRGGAMMEASMHMVESVAPTKAGAAEDIDGNIDYSETNVQVEGIDEADIIKTDGNYIYTVSGNTLFIIDAYPGEDAEIVSKIKLDNHPSGIFINDNHLAVFGNFYDTDYFKKIDFTPRYGMTFLNIYDISDREVPELEKEYKFEGSYFRARKKAGYFYLLTSTTPQIRPVPMPIIMEGNVKTTIAPGDIHYYNIPYNNPVFVNIHAVNIENPEKDINSESVVVEYSNNLYMSEDNIYITYTEYINEYEIEKQVMMELMEPYLTDADRELIEKIKDIDPSILSKPEKDQKIFEIYERYAQILDPDEQEELEDEAEILMKKKLEEYEHFEFTVINRINVDEDEITPEANGKVPGHIINQFSMDENDDIFRIATTLNPRWSRYEKQRTESTNNIYTLDSDLEILDELEGLAEDERIFSTRFIGDRLYMVTFRQVDPFFVIDLSNPGNIKELGKLKIPGFSRYLHPYDEDTIIGIGRDATETGRTKGLKISLFDVSDVKDPEEIAKYVSESRYASSTAEYEHKAFLFSKEKNLLVIPAYSYDYRDSSDNYNGALVFDISKTDIELRGLIEHSISDTNKYRYQPAVERSLYIEELLYTKSPSLLRINRIDDLEKVKNIELDYRDIDIPVY